MNEKNNEIEFDDYQNYGLKLLEYDAEEHFQMSIECQDKGFYNDFGPYHQY